MVCLDRLIAAGHLIAPISLFAICLASGLYLFVGTQTSLRLARPDEFLIVKLLGFGAIVATATTTANPNASSTTLLTNSFATLLAVVLISILLPTFVISLSVFIISRTLLSRLLESRLPSIPPESEPLRHEEIRSRNLKIEQYLAWGRYARAGALIVSVGILIVASWPCMLSKHHTTDPASTGATTISPPTSIDDIARDGMKPSQELTTSTEATADPLHDAPASDRADDNRTDSVQDADG